MILDSHGYWVPFRSGIAAGLHQVGSSIFKEMHTQREHLRCQLLKIQIKPHRISDGTGVVSRNGGRGSLKNQFSDGGQLHEGCSFVDLADLGVAIELLDWVVFDEA